MATHASAEKAARQAIKHAKRNNDHRSRFRTEIKKIKAAMAAKHEDKAEARKKLLEQLSGVQRLLMKAASKNVIKAGNASRSVGRLSKAIHRATA